MALGCNVQPQNSAAANPDAKRFAVGTAPAALALADFNGDGKLDVAVANSESKNVTILLGDGRGGLTPAAGSFGSVPAPSKNARNLCSDTGSPS